MRNSVNSTKLPLRKVTCPAAALFINVFGSNFFNFKSSNILDNSFLLEISVL